METSLQEHLGLLQVHPLFCGISPQDLPSVLSALSPAVHQNDKDSIILMAGYENRNIFILLSGEAEAVKITPDGREVIMAHLSRGDMFGDVLSGSSNVSPVTVSAHTACTVLLLPYEKLIPTGTQLSSTHGIILRNLVEIISNKYFSLSHRIDFLLIKSLRDKLSAWLLEQSHLAGSTTFNTNLSRSALASYLNCERSALSRELSRMQHDGLLETHRSSFKLLKPELLIKHHTEGEL